MTAAYSEAWTPPPLWDKAFVLDHYKITTQTLDKLCRERKVGFVNSGKKRQFTAEHLQQLLDALEVKPVVEPVDDLTLIGVSPVSAARYRRNRARAGQ